MMAARMGGVGLSVMVGEMASSAPVCKRLKCQGSQAIAKRLIQCIMSPMRFPFRRLPVICRALPTPTRPAGEAELTQRLRERFPYGTDELEFYKELDKQSFNLCTGKNSRWAEFEKGPSWAKVVYHIAWFAMDGIVEDVSGRILWRGL